ncbi:TAXI family TRAP transporter solute-binding subunit [Paracoccus mutanolyticus]|nr:TAXI family TRAP transporter solute-binding subunit [Paracoccus mutanolyticus]
MVDAGIILAAAGLAPGDFTEARLSASDAARALSRNELDAFFFVGGYPAPAIAELAGQVEISLLPIPAELARQVAQDHPFLSESTIPPGTYQGQGEAVPTLSVAAIWATSARQPDDLILSITRALWSEPSARLLRTGRPMGRAIERSHALEGLGIPLHPGAAQFYREIGMLD